VEEALTSLIGVLAATEESDWLALVVVLAVGSESLLAATREDASVCSKLRAAVPVAMMVFARAPAVCAALLAGGLPVALAVVLVAGLRAPRRCEPVFGCD
jgi:hypothetical protein